MSNIKRLCTRLNQMTDNAYAILRGALLLTCTMTLCALALLLYSGGSLLQSFEAYKTAQELVALGAVTFLIGTIASAVVEDLTRKK